MKIEDKDIYDAFIKLWFREFLRETEWCCSPRRMHQFDFLINKKYSVRDYCYYRTPQIKDMMPGKIKIY